MNIEVTKKNNQVQYIKTIKNCLKSDILHLKIKKNE